MPLLKLQTSMPVGEGERDTLLKAASRVVAEATGKPENYIMVSLDEGAFLMGG